MPSTQRIKVAVVGGVFAAMVGGAGAGVYTLYQGVEGAGGAGDRTGGTPAVVGHGGDALVWNTGSAGSGPR